MRISEALTPVCNKFDRAAAEALLAKIPADLPYNDWFRVAAALKNSSADFSLFDRWSQTAPARYDATSAKTLWNSLKANGKPGITFGTLRYIAEQYERSVQSAPVMFEMPGTTEEQALQIVEFIGLLFHVGEHFEIVADTREDKNGRKIPDRSATQITNRDGMELHEQELQSLIEFVETAKSGAWISMNPVKSDATDAPKDVDMAEFRNVLIEADSLSREEQWAQLIRLNLPIRAVTWSGGKSLHAIVKIDAGTDRELYNQRVAALYAYLAEKGFPVDAANKTPADLPDCREFAAVPICNIW